MLLCLDVADHESEAHSALAAHRFRSATKRRLSERIARSRLVARTVPGKFPSLEDFVRRRTPQTTMGSMLVVPNHEVVRLSLHRLQRQRHQDVLQALVPKQLAAYQLEWPRESICSGSDYQISIPTDSRCVSEVAESARAPRTFGLPAAHKGGCNGEAWMGLAKPGWCHRQVHAAEIYRFDGWAAFGHIDRGLLGLGVDAKRVVASLNGVSVRITEGKQVEKIRTEALKLWEEESEKPEGCRDGGRTVVRAQRREGWRS